MVTQKMVCHGEHTYLYSQLLMHSLAAESKGGSNMRRLCQEMHKSARSKYDVLSFVTFFFSLFLICGRCIEFSFSTFSVLVLLLSVLLSPSCILVYRFCFGLPICQCPLTSIFSLLHLPLSISLHLSLTCSCLISSVRIFSILFFPINILTSVLSSKSCPAFTSAQVSLHTLNSSWTNDSLLNTLTASCF